MKRPQPYRLAFAPSSSLSADVNTMLARQFQNADQMFEILFRDFGSGVATKAYVDAAIASRAFVFNYTYNDTPTEPPVGTQIRFDAAYPYTAVTKLWIRDVSIDAIDLRTVLLLAPTGSTVYVQNTGDHARFARFVSSGVAVAKSGYVEIPVTWVADDGTALPEQPVQVIKV
jgi:hypothetical protein